MSVAGKLVVRCSLESIRMTGSSLSHIVRPNNYPKRTKYNTLMLEILCWNIGLEIALKYSIDNYSPDGDRIRSLRLERAVSFTS